MATPPPVGPAWPGAETAPGAATDADASSWLGLSEGGVLKASGDATSDRRQSEMESPGPCVADQLGPPAVDMESARASDKATQRPGKKPRRTTSRYYGKNRRK
jgi:hypothetical protein